MNRNNPVQLRCRCQLCFIDLFGRVRYYAKRRSDGIWATMCHTCFREESNTLGIGRGQKFNADGVCIAGNTDGELFVNLPENIVDLEEYRNRTLGGR